MIEYTQPKGMDLLIDTRRDLLQLCKFIARERSRLVLKMLLLEDEEGPIYVSRKNFYDQLLYASSTISDDITMLETLGFPLSRRRQQVEIATNSTLQSLDFFGELDEVTAAGHVELLSLHSPLKITCLFESTTGNEVEENEALAILDLGAVTLDDPSLLRIARFFNSANKMQIPDAILSAGNTYLGNKELVGRMKRMDDNRVVSLTNRIITFKELAKLPIFDVSYANRRARVKMTCRGFSFRLDGISVDKFREKERSIKVRTSERTNYVYDL